ncbi:MAG: hypothetical protein JWQ43_1563 [Glaciihabitans sp.]|nr:hypothetical protein [Glaciihabitans sp.]
MTSPNVIVLLDVDGVLNPRLVPGGMALDDTRAALIAELASCGDIVWATSYSAGVTFALGQGIGLPSSTRAIAFPSPIHHDRTVSAPTPKLHWVARWLERNVEEEEANSTAVVWIDDQLRQDAVEWAKAQQRPTLLLSPDPYFGLAAEHLEEVREFVRGLAGKA